MEDRPVFIGGHPSKHVKGSKLLNLSDGKGTGSLTITYMAIGKSVFYSLISRAKFICVISGRICGQGFDWRGWWTLQW